MNIPIFVINLDRSADRMQAMAKRLDAQGLTYERFSGCDASKIEREFLAARYPNFLEPFDRRKSLAEPLLGGIGCYISHVEASKLILERGLEAACIMEDDAEFDDGFSLFVNAGTKYPRWAEAIKLEARVRRMLVPCCHIGKVAGRKLAYVPGNNTNGAACYIMMKAGAEKMVNIVGKLQYGALDRTVFSYEVSSIKSLHVLPYPARQLRQTSLPSTISADRTMPKKRVRKTMRQVLQIRFAGTKRFINALLQSREVIGARFLRLSLARVQTKRVEVVS